MNVLWLSRDVDYENLYMLYSFISSSNRSWDFKLILDKVQEVGKEFFSLPMEEKQKCLRAACDGKGFGSDVVISKQQVLDWNNRLFLMVWKIREGIFGQKVVMILETLIENRKRIRSVMYVVFKATTRSLKLEENVFLKHFGEEAVMQVRFNFYPPCPRSDNVLGLKPHSDKSGLTVLLQDQEVEGLQLFEDGVWSRVPTIPHALVVNHGDQMEDYLFTSSTMAEVPTIWIYMNYGTRRI
ncbi:hypothetical protein TIFTF001_016534 [Ficus carica]|uniref:Fe2OG dioxygenase domain-containing protein n=1 Tax=Ficus carica TaxID=3494 RepID=A0AA88A6H0_FICCA|nr:hypothetical protein TIFTF001_016534 [Ficus carica]